MNQAISDALTAALAADTTVRSAAEERLRVLEEAPDYLVGLVQLAVTESYPLPQRQYASVLLRKSVDKRWSATTEKFVGPEPGEEVKAAVRQLAFTGLSDSESKIRVSLAAVVSKIAHTDWPDAWPNLFDGMMNLLATGNQSQVHGAMRVLTEFMRDDITAEQLPQIGPSLLPQLLRILCADETYSQRTRARTVTIFRNCVEMLFMLKDEHPQAPEAFLEPILPSWMDTFQRLLKEGQTGSPETIGGNYAIKLEIIKTVNQMISGFPKLVMPYLLAIFNPVWHDLAQLRKQFVHQFVESGESECAQDSDGNDLSLESLIFAMFDFVSHVARRKSCKPFFLTSGPSEQNAGNTVLKQLIWMIISYMQITEDQHDAWTTNPNQFIADEDEDTYTFNVRIAAQDLLVTLWENYPDDSFAALESATHQHFESAELARSNGVSSWWKVKEACLLSIGQAAPDLIEALGNPKGTSKFDLAGLFDHVVLNSMQDTEHPFLQGRAFVFASYFARVLPDHLGSQYLNAAVTAVQSDATPPVRISALRALNNFCQYLKPELVVSSQGAIIHGCVGLASGSAEETLILVVEALMAAVKVNMEVAAQYKDVLTPLVLDIWGKFSNDHMIVGLVQDLFVVLAENPNIFPSLQQRSLPLLLNLLDSNETEQVVLSSAIDLLSILIKTNATPLPGEYVNQIFPVLMRVLLSTDDQDMLQSGQECLKFFVQKDMQQIIKWVDGADQNGLKYLMQFIAKILHPSQAEYGAAFVGDLIIKVIQKAGDQVLPVLPALLTAIITRLAAAQTPTFVQTLATVFAQLIQSQAELVIEFLTKTEVGKRNGLEVFMTVWCENFETFSGFYSLKVNSIALAKVFARADSRVNGIIVKGDLILTNNNAGRIMTRSQTKKNPQQYSSIPVPVKIIRLLVGELSNSLSTDGDGQGKDDDAADESGDEGDEWDDLDESSTPVEDYSYLSELAGDGLTQFADESEENDPDLVNDPIFQIDMKQYLTEFFQACASQNINNFAEIYEHHLTVQEKEILSKLQS